MAITIKQISSLSGFSLSTVSKALNDKFDISSATKNTIKTIAEQHNYVPNNYAVSLRGQKSKIIAVILPEVTQNCYNYALCHLQKTAESKDYRILFYQSFGCSIKEENFIKSLNDGSIGGVILIPEGNNSTYNNSIPLEILNIKSSMPLEKIKHKSEESLRSLINSAA